MMEGEEVEVVVVFGWSVMEMRVGEIDDVT